MFPGFFGYGQPSGKDRFLYKKAYPLQKRSDAFGCELDILEGGCILHGRKFGS